MNKYVSPIIEIEEVEVEDIVMTGESITPGENEGPGMPLFGGGGTARTKVPGAFEGYFN